MDNEGISIKVNRLKNKWPIPKVPKALLDFCVALEKESLHPRPQ